MKPSSRAPSTRCRASRRSGTGSCMAARATRARCGSTVTSSSTWSRSPTWPRSTCPPPSPGSRRRASCCHGCRGSPASTRPFIPACPRRPRPTRSRTSGGFATGSSATDFMGSLTPTPRAGPPRCWDARRTSCGWSRAISARVPPWPPSAAGGRSTRRWGSRLSKGWSCPPGPGQSTREPSCTWNGTRACRSRS